MIFDPELVRRIESSAARVSVATVAGFTGLAHDDPARAVPFGDGALVAFGPGRYVNRAIGASLDDPDDAGLDELERFYAASGLPPSLEVASWAPVSLVQRLAGRGYTVSWFRNVYVAGLDGSRVAAHPAMTVREVGADDVADWLFVTRAGFDAATPEEAVRQRRDGPRRPAVPGATVFLAELDGVPIGCGTLTVDGSMGWLGGAATAAGWAPARRAGRAGAPPHGCSPGRGLRARGRDRDARRRLGPQPGPPRLHARLLPGRADEVGAVNDRRGRLACACGRCESSDEAEYRAAHEELLADGFQFGFIGDDESFAEHVARLERPARGDDLGPGSRARGCSPKSPAPSSGGCRSATP